MTSSEASAPPAADGYPTVEWTPGMDPKRLAKLQRALEDIPEGRRRAWLMEHRHGCPHCAHVRQQLGLALDGDRVVLVDR